MRMTRKKSSPRNIVFVTGMSGSGMSSALKVLEDFGYEVFDNFPLSFVSDLCAQTAPAHIAISLDTRTRGFAPKDILNTVQTLRDNPKNNVTLLCMDCSNGTLQKRFSETRRAHPLAKDRPAIDGVRQERSLMKSLFDGADLLLDTTNLSIHDLRRSLESSLHPDPEQKHLTITVMSFGFKNGVPRESDMVLDVRFLQNPHWDKKLRPKTGQDKPVQKYIEQDPSLAPFLKHTKALLKTLLPQYTKEGKYYFTLAIGCTGGQHRSVYVAENLFNDIKNAGYTITLRHRDLG